MNSNQNREKIVRQKVDIGYSMIINGEGGNKIVYKKKHRSFQTPKNSKKKTLRTFRTGR